ncbi:hypothetical protein CISIN_1g0372341mg, partial [Citrus sinensis]
MISSKR